MNKYICYNCVRERYLRDEIRARGQVQICSYCGKSANSYNLDVLAERVDSAFEQHLQRTPEEPSSWQQRLRSDPESTYEWEREGEPVISAIMNAVDIAEQAAKDIQFILYDKHNDFDPTDISSETEFDPDSYYDEKTSNDDRWQEEWQRFKRALTTEARFFSHTATEHLTAVFRGIDKMSTSDGRPLVVEAGPGSTLTQVFRARVFQSWGALRDALCRPDLRLGPPPAAFAVAGRMNALGISVFYGATTSDAAIAEVRPPVGSKVAVARFDIIRPLRLVDLMALGRVIEHGSIFDPEYSRRLERVAFLRTLCGLMTRPIMPDDTAFEYLPTQAAADFLATENDPLLDGILFPSVQVAGSSSNIVLFHKAARVQTIGFARGTEIDASEGHMTDDGFEVDYSVTEQPPTRRLPDQSDSTPQWSDADSFGGDDLTGRRADQRDITLRVDLQSVRVHVVDRVQVHCSTHPVTRFRLEIPEVARGVAERQPRAR